MFLFSLIQLFIEKNHLVRKLSSFNKHSPIDANIKSCEEIQLSRKNQDLEMKLLNKNKLIHITFFLNFFSGIKWWC